MNTLLAEAIKLNRALKEQEREYKFVIGNSAHEEDLLEDEDFITILRLYERDER